MLLFLVLDLLNLSLLSKCLRDVLHLDLELKVWLLAPLQVLLDELGVQLHLLLAVEESLEYLFRLLTYVLHYCLHVLGVFVQLGTLVRKELFKIVIFINSCIQFLNLVINVFYFGKCIVVIQ